MALGRCLQFKSVLIITLAALSGCASQECMTLCGTSGPAFSFSVPSSVKMISVDGDRCPGEVKIDCGGDPTKSISDFREGECSIVSDGYYSGDEGRCILSVIFEDSTEVSATFDWTVVEGECCPRSEVEFDTGRAQLESAGVIF